MNKGRLETMRRNLLSFERQMLDEHRRVAPLVSACANITEVHGVPVKTLAAAVLDDFKDSGISRDILAKNFALVVQQESGPSFR